MEIFSAIGGAVIKLFVYAFKFIVAAAGTAFNALFRGGMDDFVLRIKSDPARSVVCLIIAAVVLTILWRSNKWYAIASFFGIYWLVWYLYNAAISSDTALFAGVPSAVGLWTYFTDTGGTWPFVFGVLFTIVAGVGAVLLKVRTTNKLSGWRGKGISGIQYVWFWSLKALAFVGIWSTLMLVYVLSIQAQTFVFQPVAG